MRSETGGPERPPVAFLGRITADSRSPPPRPKPAWRETSLRKLVPYRPRPSEWRITVIGNNRLCLPSPPPSSVSLAKTGPERSGRWGQAGLLGSPATSNGFLRGLWMPTTLNPPGSPLAVSSSAPLLQLRPLPSTTLAQSACLREGGAIGQRSAVSVLPGRREECSGSRTADGRKQPAFLAGGLGATVGCWAKPSSWVQEPAKAG